jgi:CysZ protein
MILLPRPAKNNAVTGAHYFLDGVGLLWRKELRPYILVPLAVNLVLFAALTAILIYYAGDLLTWLQTFLPTWLEWLAWLAWVVLGAIMLLVYGYSFNMITNIVAAPFYGLLAEKVEQLVTGEDLPPETLMHMIPRVTWREIIKLTYFIMRGIFIILLMLLVAFLPVINIAAPLIGLLWSAWSMAIQYADYAADNHQLPFDKLRYRLRRNIYSTVGFGGMVMGCSIIPILNIFAMPAAVTGGTLFWINEIKGGNGIVPEATEQGKVEREKLNRPEGA